MQCICLIVFWRILTKLWHHVPPALLGNVYYSFVYPYLNYGVTFWGNAASKHINKIEVQQNYIVKTKTNIRPFIKLNYYHYNKN